MASASSLSAVSVETFGDVLAGMIERGWSGEVRVESGDFEKTLYLRGGGVAFATSSVIDDRLGEVAYRSGLLTLDAWERTTLKVDRDRKFGQVLVEDGIFSHKDLWVALSMQVSTILRSLFMVPRVQFEVTEGLLDLPVSLTGVDIRAGVSLLRGRVATLELARTYGRMYREFRRWVPPDTMLVARVPHEALERFPVHTFVGDFFRIALEHRDVEALLQGSKLEATNTYEALMRLVHLGLMDLRPGVDAGLDGVASTCPALAHTIGKVHESIYRLRDLLGAEGFPAMIAQINSFFDSIDELGYLRLEEDGLSPYSLRFIVVQCEFDPRYEAYFSSCFLALDGFVRYLLRELSPSSRG